MKKLLNCYKKYVDIKKIIEKRLNILIIVILVLMIILFLNLFYVQIIKQDYYKNNLKRLQTTIVEGSTAPRGRIYDRNYNLIVDNTPVKEIFYTKPKGITTKEEIEIAYQLSELLEIDYSSLTDFILKNFWIKKNRSKSIERITDKEWQDLKERRITANDIENLKLERVQNEDLSVFDEQDKEAAYIYYLMNKGYSYSEKIIKRSATDLEYATIASSLKKLRGVDIRLDWDRTYIYGNTFRSILGTVSEAGTGIPSDLLSEYLSAGYSLDDRVGISYLEYQYDKYLRGTKNKYEVKYNGEKKLIENGKRGNDLVLTIDIKLQQEIERILEEEILSAKKEPNTEYYNRTFVIVSSAKTGEILAMSGKQIVMKDGNYQFYDYTPGILTSPVTVGSIVKGASHIVGYKYGGLQIGENRYDSCVKIAGTPQKCSWKNLGLLDDITALKHSSNTYQFYTAMKVAGVPYVYNGPLKVDSSVFEKYRSTFAQFGLGVKTEIDLPVESVGNKGTSTAGGLLLDFSIGQYDTYTPIQLSQYIGTIANNGTRLKPRLLKAVYSSDGNLDNLIYEQPTVVLNTVDIDPVYLQRVQEGFIAVMKYGGTGSGYVNLDYKPAGKTGTSQSFVDTDLDGKIDKETITNTFAAYAPYDDPQVTFTVVSPDVSNYDNNSTYQTYVNRKIAKKVSDKYFEMYG